MKIITAVVCVSLFVSTPTLAQITRKSSVAVLKAPTPPAALPRLYDFKGVALETSLEAFRIMPHPDGRSTNVICTGDASALKFSDAPVGVMIFDDIEKSLGVQKCVWVDLGDKWHTGAALNLAGSGYVSYFYSFSFIKDPNDGIMRLYEYSGKTNVAAFDAITEALSTKWGKPNISVGKVQNGIGNSFDQTTAIWENSLSSIMIQSRWTQIDDMVVIMRDKRLHKIILEAKAKKAAIPNAI